ncbi:receptor-like cytosolic serine/threonine-protein kinase rbk1 [Phtheirospermum japonicum]|uniref:non-specific serine/threonine protein kinase n=1 Tax=Phtheirospermum japonicum TaxID=374723 RepID=A0A830D0N5_9LAMI|nr:receptor-like cytosolic serine/threonine-protein kinase rbk1 [Phtheirospermum japonicum]
MATEDSETAPEMRKNQGKQISEDANKPETEYLQHAENGKGEEEDLETETKNKEINYQSSPRGVLEGRALGSGSGSDSDLMGIDWSIGSGNEKSVAGDLMTYGNVHWKKMVGQVKKTSVWKFSTISVLMGHELSKTKKTWRKKPGRNRASVEEISIDDGEFVVPKPSWRNFSYEELTQATADFCPVAQPSKFRYHISALPHFNHMAVKKITKQNKNDEDKVGDFLSELGILAHIDHPNTAKLIGFSSDKGLHLVLQFSPHGSLATVLHGCGELLEWKTRYKMAIGIAEGLQYLHCDCQKRIIHRDITASNILLSEDYEAQISDFGLAKWLPEKMGHLVVSPIEGTFGYMAPEYFMHGMVNEKTDVFAFGVLLLELLTGRRAVDSSRQSLVMWAKPLLEKNNVKEIADPRLGETYDIVDMKRAMFTALTCIHNSPTMRPSMKRVVQLLKGENEGMDMRQKTMGGRALILDACDLEEYSSTTYLKDLNRHMELVME